MQWNTVLKREGNSDIGYNMAELEDVLLSERGQSQKDTYFMVPLI